MGLFSRDMNCNAPVAPPIFSKNSEKRLLKMPSSKRLASLYDSSSPTLGVSFRREQPPSKKRRSSFSGSVAPAQVAMNMKLKSDFINEAASGEDCIEEIVDEEYYYEEEIIDDEEYYEEEIIEEIVEESKFPDREIIIKFDQFDEMQTTLHINDYSSMELEKAWYCRADYDKMVAKARSTAAKVEAKTSKSEKKKKDKDEGGLSSEKGKNRKELEIRGLEGWTTEGSQSVRNLKERAVEAVWNEQNRQWTNGVSDNEKVRSAYLMVSAGAQVVANARAAEDQVSAEKIHNKNLKQKKRDFRGMMKKSKTALGKSMKGNLISKAKNKVSKSPRKNKRVEEPEQRQIFRQPSQGSRLFIDTVDDSQSIELSVDESSHAIANSEGDGPSRRTPPRRAKLSRTASWESGLASGKY